MICPHCKYSFETDLTGLVDCPQCGKPVFIRRPVVIEEPAVSTEPVVTEAADSAGAAIPDNGDSPAEEVPPVNDGSGENPENPENPDDQDINRQRVELLKLLAEEAQKHDGQPLVTMIITPPWEDPGLSLWQRFAYTVRDVLFYPFRFFSTLPDRLTGNCTIYASLMWLFYFLVTFGMQYFALYKDPKAVIASLPPGSEELINQTFNGVEQLTATTLALLILSPVWAIIVTHILALFMQSLLWLFRIDNRGYGQTMRLVAYASTPLLFVFLPPLFGGVIFLYLPVLALGTAFAYRCRVLLAFPLALLVTIVGAVLTMNLMTWLAQLVAPLL